MHLMKNNNNNSEVTQLTGIEYFHRKFISLTSAAIAFADIGRD